MKKVIYLLAIAAVAFTGCNPLEDINAEIDAIPAEPNVGAFEYTLTDDDYSELGLNFGNFGSEDEAKNLIPDLLSDLYPLYGQGSSVLVNYKLFMGNPEGLSDYTGAQVYSMANSDYALTGSDAFGFYPDVDATDEIPTVLDARITDPTEGQIVLVEYDQYFEDPEVGLANVYEATFPGDFDAFELISVSGPDNLGWTAGTGNITGNGFDGGQIAVEEWIISPEIDLTAQSDLLFQITQEIDFIGNEDLIDVLVSTDYTTAGDVAAATWTPVQFNKREFGDLTASDNIDFSAYDGQTIHIALKYSSTDSDAARWRVESFAVKAVGVSGASDAKGEYFMYEGGSWEASEGVYYLSASDYDSMGEASGQPGRFNNFSSSTPADSYIPTFLNIEYPYAQEEDQIFVIYKYYSSSANATQTRGNSYMFEDGEWMARQTVQEASLQFGYDDGTWVPDNTIRYYLSTPDFDYISATFGDVAGYENPVASMAQYGNFDRRSNNAAFWSDDMLFEAITSLLDNSVAPNAAEGQKYVVSFDIYNGSAGVESISLIKTGGEWVYNE